MENVLIEPDVAGVIKKLSSIIEEHANDAIKTGDVFKIGLSGNFNLLIIFPTLILKFIKITIIIIIIIYLQADL